MVVLSSTTDGYSSRLEVPLSSETPVEGTLHITLPASIQPDSIEVQMPSFVTLLNRQIQRPDGTPPTMVLEFRLGSSDDTTREEIKLINTDEPNARHIRIYIGTSTFYEYAGQICDDPTEDLRDRVFSHYTDRVSGNPYRRFYYDCELLLDFETFITVLRQVVDWDSRLDHCIYRGRYPYFATRFVGPKRKSITTIEELEDKLSIYNSVESFTPVRSEHVIGQVLNTATDRRAVLNELREAGVDPYTRDVSLQTPFMAYWAAAIYLLDGLAATRKFLSNRSLPQLEDGDLHKYRAESADVGDRGREWGYAVLAGIESGEHEFAYRLANYFYWSGKEVDEDANSVAYLAEAASTVAPDSMGIFIQKAQYDLWSAKGHAARRQSQHKRAAEAFSTAADIATGKSEWGDAFLAYPACDSIVGAASSWANHHRQQDNLDAALTAIDSGLDELDRYEGHDIPHRDGRRHLLLGKRFEHESSVDFKDGDFEGATVALMNAAAHYTAADVSLSVTRVRRKLKAIEEGTLPDEENLDEAMPAQLLTPS